MVVKVRHKLFRLYYMQNLLAYKNNLENKCCESLYAQKTERDCHLNSENHLICKQ